MLLYVKYNHLLINYLSRTSICNFQIINKEPSRFILYLFKKIKKFNEYNYIY